MRVYTSRRLEIVWNLLHRIREMWRHTAAGRNVATKGIARGEIKTTY